jgi:hypothetical protein
MVLEHWGHFHCLVFDGKTLAVSQFSQCQTPPRPRKFSSVLGGDGGDALPYFIGRTLGTSSCSCLVLLSDVVMVSCGRVGTVL